MPGADTMAETRNRRQHGADKDEAGPTDIYLTIGREELIIHRRYETISIINDVCIALFFLVGSIFFFYKSLNYAGIWLFTIGSAQFLVRPMIRLARNLHLKRLPGSTWQM